MILPRGLEIIEQEKWATITDCIVSNIAPIYSISTYGRVYNSKTGNYLPQNIFYNKDKYITISLSLLDGTHTFKQIHRLELETFIPIKNSDDYEVNHKDGIKYHNWIWNLEWVTHKDNMIHAIDNNLFKFGSDRSNTVYDEQLIHYICNLISKGYSYKQVEKILGFDCEKLYHNIKNGHCWKHISKQYDFSNAFKRSSLSNVEKDMIIKMRSAEPNITPTCICVNLGYVKGTKLFHNKVEAIRRMLPNI